MKLRHTILHVVAILACTQYYQSADPKPVYHEVSNYGGFHLHSSPGRNPFPQRLREEQLRRCHLLWKLKCYAGCGCNYSAMGALTFTIYEHVVNIDEEIRQIWQKPWTNLKFLYLFLRLFSLSTQMISVAIYMMFSATGEQASLKGCRALVGLQAAACQVLMFGVQIVLILRVEALYYEKLFLRLLLRALFFGEVITVTVLLGTVIPEITYGVQCVVTWFPPRSIGYFAPPICLEALLFILTMIKFYRAVRGGWGREPIMTRFLADGIWAFALPFTVLVINSICTVGLAGPRSSIAFSWMIAAPGFAGCRLILNLSHLLGVNRTTHSMHTGDMVDTTVVTYDVDPDLDPFELNNSVQSGV